LWLIRGPLLSALLLAGAAACGDDARPPAGDAGADATAWPAADAPSTCRIRDECGPDRFCSLPSGVCVSAVEAVAAGSVHTCALHRDGRVSCWGYGRFIVPGLPVVTSPAFIDLPGPAAAVSVGIQAACALLRDGSVHCWGDLGQGVEPPGSVVNETDGKPLAGASQLAGGSSVFCATVAAGTSCWGSNEAGELGRPPSTVLPARTAVLSQSGRRPILAATVAVLVHDGGSELCGWGNNDSGLLPGPRGVVDRPACASKISGVRQLSAGDGHVCAHRGGNDFTCWGSNSGGQLGIGDDSLLEAELPGTSRTLPGAITALASGAYHVCALVQGGTVLCWGSNEHGECGQPSSSPRFAPAEAQGLGEGVVAIGSGAGAQHTCAVLADGSVVCWGDDNEGQLGSGVLSRDNDRFSTQPLQVRW
jgi:alpha-tubulin suppressor-like RCC1 family protein